MKILVLSDTHGDIEDCYQALDMVDRLDMIIHLGDYTQDLDDVKRIFNVDILRVRGNCDPLDKKTKDEMVVAIEGKKLFLTHGHNYGVKRNLNGIFYRAKELEVDIALFGHSHVPISIAHDNILLFNPGSISTPRGGSKKSFGVIEIKDNEITPMIYTID